MELYQIVKINELGMVANAVDFGMMADADRNLRLCKGFVFNYNHNNSKSSTLGVLDAIQKSYHSLNQPNLHLFVQDYGKGKSHFALVTANYFKQLLDSLEVQGILNQIKIAAGNNQGILEDLTVYKRRNSQHLVICINGLSSELDLRNKFLKALLKTLENEGVTDSLAQLLCQKPLEYLNKLTAKKISIANQYLENNGNRFGNLDNIIDFLKQDNYKVIATVKQISSQLNQGFAIDFETDLSVNKILEELITNLCSGVDAKYSGILILFDELNDYLQSWATDPFNSGGLTLQSITEACENHRSKIALVCFTQIRPLKSVPNKSTEDYKKLASRLEIAGSTYEPMSSLELVIKNLLDKQINPTEWQKIIKKWDNIFLGNSRIAYEKRIYIYHERGWTLEKFNTEITLGCFPLHPLTTYLLCNLDFTQERTAIKYIQDTVKNIIDQELVEKNDRLNSIPAISLVDGLDSNFSQPEFSRYYSEYRKAYSYIASSAIESEIAVLKGLLLFYVSQNKLHKPESEKHDVILSELTGLSEKQTKEILVNLTQKKQVIYFNQGDNTYRFYSGKNPQEIDQEIEAEASKQADKISVSLAVKHCEKEVTTYLQSQKIEGIDFIEKNQLLNDEWFFEYKFYSIAEFEQALSGYKTIENSEGKGIFAYVLAETIEELQDIRYKVDQLLSQSKHKERIAVAIPNEPVRDICRDLLKINIINRKISDEKQEAGTASEELSKQLKNKIKIELEKVIGSCKYYCLNLDKLTTTDKQNPESIISYLLQNLYSFVAPVAKNDKMALNSSKGNTIIGYVAKRLLEDNLNPNQFPNKSYNNLIDPVSITAWGLLKKTSQKYLVQIPTNKNVREAWDIISQLTALGNKQRTSINIDRIWRELSNAPFGYNEYTFTMLFTAWISYHRTEVMLQGNFGISKSKKEQIPVQEKPIKDWVTTNVFDNPKDFVRTWILESSKTPKLIRIQSVNCPEIPTRVDYDQAKKLIEEIDKFINSADPDQVKIQEINPKKQQLLDEIKKIDDRLKPIETLENLPDDVNIETLVNLYSSLQLPLSKPKTFNLANNSNASISSSTSDTIVVNPTQQHKQRHTDALQIVQDKINDFVEKLGEKSESLKTAQELGGYQVELQTAIDKITQVSLPEHLIERLNDYLQVANEKLDKIQHQSESKNCLDKIEIRYNSLSNNATQQDYIDAINDIEKLTNNVIKQESRYQQIITEIKEKQKNLETSIIIWEERLIGITKHKALELSQEISNQQNRFTQTESSQQIKKILDKLNSIILDIPNLKEAEIGNQIIILFTQLSPERQQNLYSQLEQYLSKEGDINE